jgi:hypothetical protein
MTKYAFVKGVMSRAYLPHKRNLKTNALQNKKPVRFFFRKAPPQAATLF